MNQVKRIRGRKLQRIRHDLLTKNPLCVECMRKGKIRQAVHVDHIVALANEGQEVASNRQGLCIECHAAKTAVDLGQVVKNKIGADGWPE